MAERQKRSAGGEHDITGLSDRGAGARPRCGSVRGARRSTRWWRRRATSVPHPWWAPCRPASSSPRQRASCAPAQGGSRIGAIRLGMAQLANTPARVVLLLPHGDSPPSLVALLSLVDAAKRAPDSHRGVRRRVARRVARPRAARCLARARHAGGERTRRGRRTTTSRAHRGMTRCRSLDSLAARDDGVRPARDDRRYARCP